MVNVIPVVLIFVQNIQVPEKKLILTKHGAVKKLRRLAFEA
jgi:hypothetical protein